MPRIGIINLGLSNRQILDFKSSIESSLYRCQNWEKDKPITHYKHLKLEHLNEIAKWDLIVLSSGNARIGLPTHVADKDPQLLIVYDLIHCAAQDGTPLIGVNAGHEAINCAYNWGIEKIPEEIKDFYHNDHQVRLSDLINQKYNTEKSTLLIQKPTQAEKNINIEGIASDPISDDVKCLRFRLTNNWGVVPRPKKRPGQSRIRQLATFMDYPLVSRVASDAPIYGFQFGPGEGAKEIYNNFFQLANKYLESG